MDNTFGNLSNPTLSETENMHELLGFELKDLEVECSAANESAGITGCLSCS